jgi:hypothetical protein
MVHSSSGRWRRALDGSHNCKVLGYQHTLCLRMQVANRGGGALLSHGTRAWERPVPLHSCEKRINDRRMPGRMLLAAPLIPLTCLSPPSWDTSVGMLRSRLLPSHLQVEPAVTHVTHGGCCRLCWGHPVVPMQGSHNTDMLRTGMSRDTQGPIRRTCPLTVNAGAAGLQPQVAAHGGHCC